MGGITSFGRWHQAHEHPALTAVGEVDLPWLAGGGGTYPAILLSSKMDNKLGGLGAALSTPSKAWALQTVVPGGQEPSPTDQQFLVSLHRVPASHQVVFVHAPLRQAIFGRHFQPPLAARHSPASGNSRDPPAQFDPGAWQVTAPRLSWP